MLGIDRVGTIKDEDVESMFATNVLGLISMTQLLIIGGRPSCVLRGRCLQLKVWDIDFKERKTGHVINIGSIAGREPYANGSIYCATKHAVSAFTGSLMRELVDTPIRVTEIQPGMLLCTLVRQVLWLKFLQAWWRQNFPWYDSGETSLLRIKYTKGYNRVRVPPVFTMLFHLPRD